MVALFNFRWVYRIENDTNKKNHVSHIYIYRRPRPRRTQPKHVVYSLFVNKTGEVSWEWLDWISVFHAYMIMCEYAICWTTYGTIYRLIENGAWCILWFSIDTEYIHLYQKHNLASHHIYRGQNPYRSTHMCRVLITWRGAFFLFWRVYSWISDSVFR